MTDQGPTPSDMGLDLRYNSWYPNQEHAFNWIWEWLNTPSPTAAVCAPTGSGKSVLALLSAVASGQRTVILTGTKALQDQYREQHGGAVVDLRGAKSYACAIEPGVSADDGLCKLGYPCRFRDTSGCSYWDAIRRASKAPVLLTNYHCWLAHGKTGLLNPAGVLVLDEAHQAYDALCSFLTIELWDIWMKKVGIEPPESSDTGQWASWAGAVLSRVQERLEVVKSGVGSGGPNKMVARELRGLARMHDSLVELRTVGGDWIVSRMADGWMVTPLWPKDHIGALVRGSKKTLLLSAFLTPKTTGMLGVENPQWLNIPSAFPVQNRMVIHVPTARANRNMDVYERGLWLSRIDQIIGGRKDRKGIIHSVSYKRRDQIMDGSENRKLMVTHQAGDVVQVVERFKHGKPPLVLVSPSIHTGWDFPHGQCRYNIISKIPYPDTRDPVTAARTKADPEWPMYHAMSVVVQAAGRGVRAMDDWCDTFIIDDDWAWFWPKNKQFSPPWFREAVGRESTIPMARRVR